MPQYASIQAFHQAITEGTTTCEATVLYYLSQIKATEKLNIYIEIFVAEALARARALDEKRKNTPESVGTLFGVVVSLKDVICYEGHTVTAGSKILAGFKSLFSATAVQKLLAQDAIIIGRVNCDEFAMGSSNENSCYGATRNAIDPTKVPGGSSGASAVSVQADTCLVSLGSDTGGSVRQPAAFCGIVGMKPTYGRISRYGLLAYGSSFDQIGILANCVADTAQMLEVIAGGDDFDSTSSQLPVEKYSEIPNSPKKSKIAYFDSALNSAGMDADIRQLTFDYIKKLKSEGHTVEPVAFDLLDYIIPTYYILTTAEASSNLSRYDGVRYGHRNKDAKSLEEVYLKSRTDGFGTEVKRRIMLGTFVLSAGYYDAYYSKAQQIRRLIYDRTKAILADFDFILMPASPITAWNIGEKSDDPVAVYLADIFTVQANMTGMPAIALPIGTHPNGLPVGVQLMADKFCEQALFAFASEWA
jgi:aspartyl-tRNA(Asn)/glutamyl-tRNA(Gln) amidotransferase subunit A